MEKDRKSNTPESLKNIWLNNNLLVNEYIPPPSLLEISSEIRSNQKNVETVQIDISNKWKYKTPSRQKNESKNIENSKTINANKRENLWKNVKYDSSPDSIKKLNEKLILLDSSKSLQNKSNTFSKKHETKKIQDTKSSNTFENTNKSDLLKTKTFSKISKICWDKRINVWGETPKNDKKSPYLENNNETAIFIKKNGVKKYVNQNSKEKFKFHSKKDSSTCRIEMDDNKKPIKGYPQNKNTDFNKTLGLEKLEISPERNLKLEKLEKMVHNMRNQLLEKMKTLYRDEIISIKSEDLLDDGELVFVLENDETLIAYSDGKIKHERDGLYTMYLPNGNIIDCSAEQLVNKKSFTELKIVKHKYSDGTVKYTIPNGCTHIEYPDGSIEITMPNGKVTVNCGM
ncbi:hypothetical protein BB558_006032 [Smittium angustum]|uniref:Centromere protein J C-terminal domain-containing protein n=1 Tax=Smittium angustum TaxID=133377 RepID=A0A2U1IYW0_SMIAN|nr:hypothetical protein BB558_006032 [Smittium angustum]